MGTLKPHSNGPLCSNTVICTLALIDGCPHIHLVQRGGVGGGYGAAQTSPRCSTKCNSPPINGQRNNFILFDMTLYLPLHSKAAQQSSRVYLP